MYHVCVLQCTDGYEGNGTCNCDMQYSGAACEFCRDKNKFGPNCDQGKENTGTV